MPSRRHKTMNSLYHAYPTRSQAWRRGVFRESSARLFEMGLFRIASAFFSAKRMEATLEICPKTQELITRYSEGGECYGRPVVIMLPHMTMAESATMLPARALGIMPVHAIFRPLNQASINAWVTSERERYGAKMISRRNGYNDAMAALRRGEMVTVLFDQDASNKGSTITFMDRVVSATDLPALMAQRFNADVFLMLTERRDFWQAKLTLTQLPKAEDPTEITIHAHHALAQYLQRDASAAADWLWLHDRWDHFYSAHKRFRLPEKRNCLELSSRILGTESTPRKTNLWVRMPNWLGDVVMALPVLRAIQAGRPDFKITLIGKSAFKPLFDRLGVGDAFIPLPARGRGYFKSFYDRRFEYPDTYLLFTNSSRSDLEAVLTRCRQRFGMLRPGKRRPLLTNPFPLSEELDETLVHQTHVWEQMARYYGLQADLDFTPIPKASKVHANRVGLICGTENAPEKRWPIAHWRELVEKLLDASDDVEIDLYGTPADRAITDQVAAGFPEARVRNLAGKTDLSEFCDGLNSCAVVSCNDTGGMHLANMLGTPVVAIFGPTNPVRTGPIFEAPARILQPEGCPKTGGAEIDGVSSGSAYAAIQSYLGSSAK